MRGFLHSVSRERVLQQVAWCCELTNRRGALFQSRRSPRAPDGRCCAVVGNGPAFLRQACKLGAEGLMSKLTLAAALVMKLPSSGLSDRFVRRAFWGDHAELSYC